MPTILISTKRQLEMPGMPDGPFARKARGRYGRPAGLSRVRADSLPEYTRYRDDGCDIHATCLTCPLPRCRYEEPGGLRAILNDRRDRQIVALRLRGVPVDDLAGRFHISRRTVFRVLAGRPVWESKNGVARRRAPRTPDTVVRMDDRRPEERREAHCA